MRWNIRVYQMNNITNWLSLFWHVYKMHLNLFLRYPITIYLFKKHILNICKSAFYHIRGLRRIPIHFDKAIAIYRANALVSSLLDKRWAGQVGSQILSPCSRHGIGCLLNHVLNLNWTFSHIKHSPGNPSYFIDLLHFKNRQQSLRSATMKLLHLGPRPKRNYGHSSFVVSS